MNARQCATLPRKMTLGSKLPAPMPPRRDPKTTLSVGRARAKSMVAGLESGSGSIEKEDDDDLPGTTKSSSVESIHQQSLSSSSTPIQSGTPVQLRTASIKARPTSSRITAAELVELFQRQTGNTSNIPIEQNPTRKESSLNQKKKKYSKFQVNPAKIVTQQ